MAEPVGSCIWNYFREWSDGNDSVFPRDQPYFTQITEICDLGAGMCTKLLVPLFLIVIVVQVLLIFALCSPWRKNRRSSERWSRKK